MKEMSARVEMVLGQSVDDDWCIEFWIARMEVVILIYEVRSNT